MSYSFARPRRVATLAAAGSSLSVLNPLYVAVAALLAGIYVWVGSYAVMIIVLGAGIALLSTPLAAATWRTQIARARLVPKLDELKRQHGHDRNRLAAEIASLLKQHGISPWAGCLPALLSAPIYLSIYRVAKGLTDKPTGSVFFRPRYLSHSTRLFHALASSAAMNSWGVNLATTGVAAIQLSAASAGLFLAVVAVAVAAGIWQQHMIKAALPRPSASTPSPADRLSTIVPALFAVSALVLPLAVSLYYATASLVRLAQQWALMRIHPL
jgi:YidC/Oxa1 family membrane protein insertase